MNKIFDKCIEKLCNDGKERHWTCYETKETPCVDKPRVKTPCVDKTRVKTASSEKPRPTEPSPCKVSSIKVNAKEMCAEEPKKSALSKFVATTVSSCTDKFMKSGEKCPVNPVARRSAFRWLWPASGFLLGYYLGQMNLTGGPYIGSVEVTPAEVPIAIVSQKVETPKSIVMKKREVPLAIVAEEETPRVTGMMKRDYGKIKRDCVGDKIVIFPQTCDEGVRIYH